jgi:hypothetical protein
MVRAYAFPYNNTTSCTYSANWVSTNGLSLYMPYDSGATQVAHYGGFGMPTVVLLGGLDHRIMFSTLSFSTSDTTIMRDSIMALYNAMNQTGLADMKEVVNSFSIYPNPANDNISLNINLKRPSNLLIDICDISGRQIEIISNERHDGIYLKDFNTSKLPNGNYYVRLRVDNKSATQKLTISH